MQHEGTTTRRAVLSAAVLVPAIAAPAALAAPRSINPDAELLDLLSRSLTAWEKLCKPAASHGLDPRVDVDDCPVRSAWEAEAMDCLWEAVQLPCRTLAGALAKLRAAQDDVSDPWVNPGDEEDGRVTYAELLLDDVARFLAEVSAS